MNLDKSNSRRHSDRNKAAIRKSLETAKAARSIVIDSGDNVLAGNGVAEQAEALGIPVQIVESDGSKLIAVKRVDVAPDSPQARQIATLDNLVADTSAFDYDAERLRAALANDPVSKAIAEQDERLRKLLKVTKPESVDAGELVDKAAQLQEKWQVRRGDLWQCGKHRILCGDSTNAEDVARVIEKDGTLVTDPPYGIGYEYASHDDSSNQDNEKLVKAAFGLASPARIWTCGLMKLARDLVWNEGARVLCWHKKFAAAGNGMGGASTWETVLVVGIKKGTLPNDYLEFPTDRVPGLRELHPCPKPVALFAHLIEHLAGDTIYDPFLGSGTTLIAAEQTGRIGRGVEIEPKYVAVSLERLANLGLTCERIENG